mgnify:CR=1 FL=1
MTNLNAKNFISLYVTRVNSLNNAIFKDLENGKDSHTYKACVELTTLSNEELYENGYKSLFEFKTNKKGKKVLIKKRIYRNETVAYKSIIENIDKIVEFCKTEDAKTCKVNKLRGVMDKTNAYFRPKTKKPLKKSQVVTSNKQDENVKDTFLSTNEFIELATAQEFTKSDIEKIILGLQKIHSKTKKVA